MEQQVPLNSSSEMENNVVPDIIVPDPILFDSLQRTTTWRCVKDEYWRYIPLLKAVLRGNWDAARRFFVQDESAITAPINDLSETALYIAVRTGERAIQSMIKESSPELFQT
ncbi:hypothetical protein RHSIM_Rhsim05G0147800 [Rhododendron simsii]|uniref:Ankyrin repeat family protein n=1 Tax=Rhododendron simsii TaxID=118357 RepID=A0A834LKM1_RHOSS|nr:hypothetical protein RHSIM_Rhsim05G0147800 [Rhododendron simsii]